MKSGLKKTAEKQLLRTRKKKQKKTHHANALLRALNINKSQEWASCLEMSWKLQDYVFVRERFSWVAFGAQPLETCNFFFLSLSSEY